MATTIVQVIPPVAVNAGNDTAIVVGQSLQLLETASTNMASFIWSPATYLSKASFYHPIAGITTNSNDSFHDTAMVTKPGGMHRQRWYYGIY